MSLIKRINLQHLIDIEHRLNLNEKEQQQQQRDHEDVSSSSDK